MEEKDWGGVVVMSIAGSVRERLGRSGGDVYPWQCKRKTGEEW